MAFILLETELINKHYFVEEKINKLINYLSTMLVIIVTIPFILNF